MGSRYITIIRVVFHWTIESIKNDAVISAQVFIY